MIFTHTEDYRHLQCSQCGVNYFFPEKWCLTAGTEKTSWRCPNGHGQQFKVSQLDAMRRERDRLAQRIAEKDDEIKRQSEMRQAAERREVAAKGQATKLRKRIGNGVCACCNRSFPNLERHMKSKHPEFHCETVQ